ILERNPIIYNEDLSINEILNDLYNNHGITSVLVEAGPTLLQSFIDDDLWDIMRVEVSPQELGSCGTCPAPHINCIPQEAFKICGNTIYLYSNK
ncbi:MAG: dihydrofolate reductase family protein, partial [Muribaculaceae bacterium]|nr:dihydrofolate reductase family protein [Muribaculaceae bacterium]